MSKVRVLHQIDACKGIAKEWWLLDGVSYRAGQALRTKGFEWIRGPDGGCWQAPDQESVQVLIDSGVPVIETGNGHR